MSIHTLTRTNRVVLEEEKEGRQEKNPLRGREIAALSTGHNTIVNTASRALHLAANYSFDTAQPDGHWLGELKSNASITAEYVMLKQALKLGFSDDGDDLRSWLLSEQNPNGSWGIAPDYRGDVSTTAEVYLALKILGLVPGSTCMTRARNFVVSSGGLAKVRIFTRIFFAMFGLFPWSSVPQLPAELILLPSWAPMNIYKFSSWARSTIVPLLVICHHQPIYELPNGRSPTNDFLDELWCNATYKEVPLAKPFLQLISEDLFAAAFLAIDTILHWLGGLRQWPLRSYALRVCVDWILSHQESSGDWAGIFPPMHSGIFGLTLEGLSPMDRPVSLGLAAIERFAWRDREGKRIQACLSPVWDTILTSIALSDAGLGPSDARLNRAVDWVKARQILGPAGDWRVYSPDTSPGGFCFEYHNDWYPDIDDTAAAVIAFLKHDPSSVSSPCVVQAVEWILGMQGHDGGWAAFDKDNDHLFLNKIPFSDMDSLCDPSTADVTGRVLEAFGLLLTNHHCSNLNVEFVDRIKTASERGIAFLLSTQHASGAWYGRWGANYIYGTSNVICGLSHFLPLHCSLHAPLKKATTYILALQNSDGGWGESLTTYLPPSTPPTAPNLAPSTPSQTAWALMALLAYLPPSDEAIRKGVVWLVLAQTEKVGEGATWPERQFTGTGFPGHFYLGYDLYRHYFPVMALGRYVRAMGGEALGG